jgi:hypothetical protein
MKKEDQQFISLAEAAKMTNYSQDYISLLCRQGKLKAEKLGRNWVTKKDWVYSYVDNTQGRGESVVPVKVKNNAKEDGGKKVGEKKEEGKKNPSFFGQSVLEIAFFCFACLIWLVNIFLFASYVQREGFSPDAPQVSASSTRRIPIPPVDEKNFDSNAIAVSESCTGTETLDNLTSFEKETDSAVIEKETNEIRARFSGDIEASIYKNFAILNYKNNPDKKFLYMMNK